MRERKPDDIGVGLSDEEREMIISARVHLAFEYVRRGNAIATFLLRCSKYELKTLENKAN